MTQKQDAIVTFEDVKQKTRTFVQEREWGQFHNPKNMSMAISSEAAELVEHFLWCRGEESSQVLEASREDVEDEVADIAILLCMFADENNIDLSSVIERKLEKNRQKYPVQKSRGKSTKYTKL